MDQFDKDINLSEQLDLLLVHISHANVTVLSVLLNKYKNQSSHTSTQFECVDISVVFDIFHEIRSET